MPGIKRAILTASSLLALLLLLIVQPRAQEQIPGFEQGIPSAGGRVTLASDYSTYLECNRLPPGSYLPDRASGGFVTLIFSFGQASPAKSFGSWTARGLTPGVGGARETVNAYYFDGKLNTGTLAPLTYKNPSYELRGTATYNGLCTPHDTTTRNVRIWGRCGTNQAVNFEVTDERGVFAHATFRGNITCANVDESRINRNLDSH